MGQVCHCNRLWKPHHSTLSAAGRWLSHSLLLPCCPLCRWMPDPAAVNISSWLMYKLGRPVSPLDVIRNGSHSLHVVGDEGIAVQTSSGTWLRIRWANFPFKP